MKFRTFLDEKLKDPEFKKYYDEYMREYQIAEEIIKAREELKLTQKELAEKVGIRQSNISRIESGTYNPSVATLRKIAKGLNKELYITLK